MSSVNESSDKPKQHRNKSSFQHHNFQAHQTPEFTHTKKDTIDSLRLDWQRAVLEMTQCHANYELAKRRVRIVERKFVSLLHHKPKK